MKNFVKWSLPGEEMADETREENGSQEALQHLEEELVQELPGVVVQEEIGAQVEPEKVQPQDADPVEDLLVEPEGDAERLFRAYCNVCNISVERIDVADHFNSIQHDRALGFQRSQTFRVETNQNN